MIRLITIAIIIALFGGCGADEQAESPSVIVKPNIATFSANESITDLKTNAIIERTRYLAKVEIVSYNRASVWLTNTLIEDDTKQEDPFYSKKYTAIVTIETEFGPHAHLQISKEQPLSFMQKEAYENLGEPITFQGILVGKNPTRIANCVIVDPIPDEMIKRWQDNGGKSHQWN